MRNSILTALFLIATLTTFAQSDTLDVGDYRLVINQADTSYTLFSKSTVIADYYIPVAVLPSTQDAVDFLYNQADQFYSNYALMEVKARELGRQSRLMGRLLQEVDTFKVQDIALTRYTSQLAGDYVLVYNGVRSLVNFNERLISVRAGQPNLRMVLFSNNNMKLVNLEAKPIDFFAENLGDFWGVDAAGNNVRLRKRE